MRDAYLIRHSGSRALVSAFPFQISRPRCSSTVFLTGLLLVSSVSRLPGQKPDVQTIIDKSVQANKKDFEAAPAYNHKELDRSGQGSKLYLVTMIDGTPYQRLIAVNGKPLSPSQEAKENEKQDQATSQRKAESSEQRQRRIAKYEKDRRRDHNMMEQLTEAFNFTLVGENKFRNFSVYVLKATPRPGYKPPNMDCQVLPGMQGQLWIDQKTFQWVKVTAQVIHPVSIEGFLAQVEPGTRFELEKAPVENGIWLPSHFAMQSHAKVLFMVNRSSSANETYSDYTKAGSSGQANSPPTASHDKTKY